MIEFDVETKGLQWYDQPGQQMFLAQFFDPEDEDCEGAPPRCSCGSTDIVELGGMDGEFQAAPWLCNACGLDHEWAYAPVILRHPEDREEIQRWLKKPGPFRAWNSKFDLHHLEAAGYTLPPEDAWYDGMLLAHAIDGKGSAVGLQAVGNRLFGVEDQRDEDTLRTVREGAGQETEDAVKAWLKEETHRRRKESKATGVEFVRPNYSDVPAEIMYPYAAHDVTLQRRICDALEPKAGDLSEVLELERGVLPAAYAVERRGFRVDREGALAMERELEGTLERVEDECRELSGDPEFNPGSGAQIAAALEARGADLKGVRKLKNGKPATDKEALAKVDDPLARAVEAYRDATKLYSTNIKPILHPELDTTYGYRAPYLASDGRLHTNIRQVGARTGRMSSSDPNVQNWPRDDLRMRHLVQASEGHKLIAVDLDSIELRVFAAFVGEGDLLRMMSDPDSDLHSYTADMIGLYDFDRGGGVIESARQRGKKFNYSIIYGAGVRSIQAAFGVNQEKAKEMIWAYHDTFPEVGEFQRSIEATLEDQGYVRTPWGRKHHVYNQRHVDREAYKFGNYLVQGTSADLFKVAVVRCHEAGIPMVALTHDEILADVPEDEVDSAATIIVDALTNHERITKIIPLYAEAKVVDRWSHAKDPEYDPGWTKEN